MLNGVSYENPEIQYLSNILATKKKSPALPKISTVEKVAQIQLPSQFIGEFFIKFSKNKKTSFTISKHASTIFSLEEVIIRLNAINTFSPVELKVLHKWNKYFGNVSIYKINIGRPRSNSI